ncbi:hypothetical protein AWN68_17835 [Roseivirga echinicomitans]|uniref:tRNA_anti-like n=2 Tax=Roseivirga echinicomitans TaxID=296218 RepID=A0A150XK97_9BACT|nr:hypothetical protein AWN68_17835 [Roseivirga echinicomitans]
MVLQVTKKTIMKKRSLIALTIVVTLATGYFIYASMTQGPAKMKNLKAEHSLTAVDFYSEYETDETAANTKYQNKIVEVKGVVESITLDEESKPSISLRTEGFGVVKCTLESNEDNSLDNVKLNSTLTVRGECIGMLLDVLLERTIIIEPK